MLDRETRSLRQNVRDAVCGAGDKIRELFVNVQGAIGKMLRVIVR